MKRIAGFSLMAFAALALELTLVPASAQAKATNKTIWTLDESAAYGWKAAAFKPTSKSFENYDLTGDGKADALRFKLTAKGKLLVYVNGRKAAAVPAFDIEPYIQVKYLTLKNGTPFLYIRYSGVNGDGTYAVYQGKGGNKLVKVASNLDFPKKYATVHRYLGAVKPSGNKLLITYEPMTYAAGTLQMTYAFKASKKGATVKRISSTTSKLGLSGSASTKSLHPIKRLTLYTTAKARKVAGYASKGGKLALKKVCLKGGAKGKAVMFKVKTASGLSGWFKAPTKQTNYFGNGHVGTLFQETSLAG